MGDRIPGSKLEATGEQAPAALAAAAATDTSPVPRLHVWARQLRVVTAAALAVGETCTNDYHQHRAGAEQQQGLGTEWQPLPPADLEMTVHCECAVPHGRHGEAAADVSLAVAAARLGHHSAGHGPAGLCTYDFRTTLTALVPPMLPTDVSDSECRGSNQLPAA
jgi:hypothetical protein